jgi:hypothetical protein
MGMCQTSQRLFYVATHKTEAGEEMCQKASDGMTYVTVHMTEAPMGMCRDSFCGKDPNILGCPCHLLQFQQ